VTLIDIREAKSVEDVAAIHEFMLANAVPEMAEASVDGLRYMDHLYRGCNDGTGLMAIEDGHLIGFLGLMPQQFSYSPRAVLSRLRLLGAAAASRRRGVQGAARRGKGHRRRHADDREDRRQQPFAPPRRALSHGANSGRDRVPPIRRGAQLLSKEDQLVCV
jgi:hypothetical protein